MDHGLGGSDHGGHGHGHGDYDGHPGSATHEALFVLHGSHADHHFSFSHSNTGHQHVAHYDHSYSHSSSLDRQGSTYSGSLPVVNDAGEVIRAYALNIANHGQTHVLAEIRKLAKRSGLFSLSLRPGYEPASQVEHVILDSDPWAHASELNGGLGYNVELYGPRPPSLGWYPGAEGRTELTRQCWQLGRHVQGALDYDPKAKTYLDISVVVWTYKTGDFETRLDIRIVSNQEWHEISHGWGYRSTPFLRHQKVAIEIYQTVMELLSKTAPIPAAVFLRQQYDVKALVIKEDKESLPNLAAHIDSLVHAGDENKTSSEVAGKSDLSFELDD
ncbi:hypothetical protein BH10CYA1_BH10CYA1_53350 [soil metagenome]